VFGRKQRRRKRKERKDFFGNPFYLGAQDHSTLIREHLKHFRVKFK
jgi:hypothetical protein